MDVIQSKIDTTGAEFPRNREIMLGRVADLKEALRVAREERSDKARVRHVEQGKLPVQERLNLLLDPGTPFLEIAPLAAKGHYDGKVHGAGIRAGIGIVSGREVMVTGSDAMVKGGTLYPLGVKKSLRVQQIVMENRLPVVNMIDSGGAYLPLQSEVFPDADDGGRVFYNQAHMSRMSIPQITAVMGLCTAGAAYIPAMSDHVVHVRGTGAIFLGGPPLVRAATGEVVSNEDLGGADLHCRESGVSDYQAEDDADAIARVRQIVSRLPRGERMKVDTRDVRPPVYDSEEIYGIVPESNRTPYDVRELLARTLDGSEFLEFKALFGPTLVCGWGYIHGQQVGIVGNNGVLLSESAQKATQFIDLCDRDGIPLLFLQNINGFMIGRDYEAGGITKHGHKMVMAVSLARVPKLTVILGGSFAAGNYAMCGRAYGPRFLWMWPNAQISVMGPEQAGDVLVTVKRDQMERQGLEPLDDEAAEAIRSPVVAMIEGESDAYHSTSHLWDDGILDPAATRDALGLGLSAATHSPLAPRSPGGVYRM